MGGDVLVEDRDDGGDDDTGSGKRNTRCSPAQAAVLQGPLIIRIGSGVHFSIHILRNPQKSIGNY